MNKELYNKLISDLDDLFGYKDANAKPKRMKQTDEEFTADLLDQIKKLKARAERIQLQKQSLVTRLMKRLK